MQIALILFVLLGHEPGDFGGSIQACLDASATDGTPCVLPPGVWDVYSRAGQPGLGNPYQWAGLQVVRNDQPVTLRGYGPASVLRMAGDGHGADFYLLGTWHAHDVSISDLTLDGSGRTGGFAEQQHLVNFGYGSKRIRVERVVGVHPALAPNGGGDVLRLLGGYTEADLVEDVTIRDVRCVNADRSCIGFQRGVKHVTVDRVISIGTGDQDLDMEATGILTPAERIQDVTIRRFTAIRPSGGLAISLGRGDRISVADSTILGGSIFLLSCHDCSLTHSTLIGQTNGAVVTVRRASERVRIFASRIARTGGLGPLVEAYADSDGSPRGLRVESCDLGQTAASPAVLVSRVEGFRVEGNAISTTTPAGAAIDASFGWGRATGNDVLGPWSFALAIGRPTGPIFWALNLLHGPLYGAVCIDHWADPGVFSGVSIGVNSGAPNACPDSVFFW